MESIAADILREILLKLPPSDVGRCWSVSRRWRRIVGDPASFHRLHAKAKHAVVEALLVSHGTLPGPGRSLETSVLLSVSSAPTRRSRVEVAGGYHPASVCNGFVLLTYQVKIPYLYHRLELKWLLVWNPVTGEKLRIPAPSWIKCDDRDVFAMGFSGGSIPQYKIFRLPLKEQWRDDNNYVYAYTIGGGKGSGWRRHPDPFQRSKVYWAGSPSTVVDGKLYVLMRWSVRYPPNRVLVVDVGTEARRSYCLMEGYKDAGKATMETLELAGRLCVAVHVLDGLHLWIMPRPPMVACGQRQPGGGRRQLAKKLPGVWELRYSFHRDRPVSNPDHDEPRGAWVDDDGSLCCVMGDHLYKCGTANQDEDKQTDKEEIAGRFLAWDQKLRLPPRGHIDGRWHIYWGYRPTLLSP